MGASGGVKAIFGDRLRDLTKKAGLDVLYSAGSLGSGLYLQQCLLTPAPGQSQDSTLGILGVHGDSNKEERAPSSCPTCYLSPIQRGERGMVSQVSRSSGVAGRRRGLGEKAGSQVDGDGKVR
jgi:hypothetical protein